MGKRKRQAASDAAGETTAKRAKTNAPVIKQQQQHTATSSSASAATVPRPLHVLKSRVVFKPNSKDNFLPKKPSCLFGKVWGLDWNKGGKILSISMESRYCTSVSYGNSSGAQAAADDNSMPNPTEAFKVLLQLRGPWAGDPVLHDRIRKHSEALYFSRNIGKHRVEPSKRPFDLTIAFSERFSYSTSPSDGIWFDAADSALHNMTAGQPQASTRTEPEKSRPQTGATHLSATSASAAVQSSPAPRAHQQNNSDAEAITSPVAELSIHQGDEQHSGHDQIRLKRFSVNMTALADFFRQRMPGQSGLSVNADSSEQPRHSTPPRPQLPSNTEFSHASTYEMANVSLSQPTKIVQNATSQEETRIDEKAGTASAPGVERSEKATASSALKPRLSEAALREIADSTEIWMGLQSEDIAPSSGATHERRAQAAATATASVDQLSQARTAAKEWPQPAESPARLERLSALRPQPGPNGSKIPYKAPKVEGYRHVSARELHGCSSNSRVDFMGVVVGKPQARETQKRNFSLNLHLCDPSEPNPAQALPCQMFAPKKVDLPLELERGDVVLMRGMRIQFYNSRPQLIKADREPLQLAYSVDGDTFSFHQQEFEILRQEKEVARMLSKWFAGLPETVQHAAAQAKVKSKQHTVSELKAGHFSDLVVEVLSARPWSFPTSAAQTGGLDLLVTDYTSNSCRDRPDLEAVLGLGSRKGLAFRITCWDSLADQAANLWGEWQSLGPLAEPAVWHFVNVQVKSLDSMLEGNLREDWNGCGNKRISVVGKEDERVVQLLRRREEFMTTLSEERAQAEAARRPLPTPAVFEGSLAHTTPLVSLLQSLDVDCLYRCPVRIRDYRPRQLKDWKQMWCSVCDNFVEPQASGSCPECNDTELVSQWFFVLLVECGQKQAVQPIIASGSAAENFLQGLKPSNSDFEDRLARLLAPAFGQAAEQVLSSDTIIQSPVFDAGIMAFRKDEQRMLFLTDTRLISQDQLQGQRDL